jgi:hypothetical protein
MKKRYMMPSIEVQNTEMEQEMLAASIITTTGLDDDNLNRGTEDGDAWTDAMSRQNVWDEE